MADPEIPEVRAEVQREDRPQAGATYNRIGPRKWLWLAFALTVVLVVALAYGLAR